MVTKIGHCISCAYNISKTVDGEAVRVCTCECRTAHPGEAHTDSRTHEISDETTQFCDHWLDREDVEWIEE